MKNYILGVITGLAVAFAFLVGYLAWDARTLAQDVQEQRAVLQQIVNLINQGANTQN